MLIYILEDDASIRKLVMYTLESQGYEVEGFEVPSAFWQAMAQRRPELVLLDIMLPEEDGLSVLQKLRAEPSTHHLPVVMLTARNTEYDRVVGLDSGADDFISKPFGMMELLARIRALLRRTDGQREEKIYRFGALEVSPEAHTALIDGQPVALTHKEFELLCLLLERRGRVVSRETLLGKVWGLGNEPENRTLDVHIRTLRAKLGELGNYIETVRGVGYRMGERT